MIRQPPIQREDPQSQIPAIQLLANMGWAYLTPKHALDIRGGKRGNVLLEGILVPHLRKLNRIQYKGRTEPFSEGNILSAVEAMRSVPYDGLIRTNEKIYDLLCLGKSLPQSVDGDVKSFSLRYIDWENPDNNVYHVTEEFEVERTGSHETRRPDIVLFVNGIPLVVIECKSPHLKEPLEQAVSQQIRNQKEDEIPCLFLYSQTLFALAVNEARFGTTGTAMKFWSVWNEPDLDEERLKYLVNKPISEETEEYIFETREESVREQFTEYKRTGRLITKQDRMIFSLCRPERLLEIAFQYILYDAGEKKIARSQQYFCVNKTLERVKTLDEDGKRRGGVVWHTQGSGKSLTMVMLAKALALDSEIKNPRIVLVTDRVDLDDQIYNTFRHCGKEPVQAKTGAHLLELLKDPRNEIITTVIDKFEASKRKRDARLSDPNIFVLVDEGHRSQYGPRHVSMRGALPRGCFIGFTGTPLMKIEKKDTMKRFGPLIDTYTIDKAVRDKAVVPLLYEGRDVPQYVDEKAIDQWFEKETENLTDKQKADLKRKFSTADQINKAEQKVKMIAWDVSRHFKDAWQGTGFKAQLAAPDKATALLYKKYFDLFGIVKTEVLISGPDEREGNEDIYGENRKKVQTFWKRMMDRYGNEKEYNRQLINSFKTGEEPEIIIVVSKLLTGFDAPRNAVFYLTKDMKEHTLLQAIARVNRVYEGKEYGYVIDYYGVLGELDKAMDLYSSLGEFDREDLVGAITDLSEETAKLPQKYSDLWDVFKGVKNKRDQEEYERLLADEALRDRFYERLSEFARALQVSLSSIKFIEKTPEERVERYKRDLKFFMNLRQSVRRRYAEAVDFREYEQRIQKLIDTHIGAGEVEQLTPLVNIFDEEAFSGEVEKLHGATSKADMIASQTKRTIEEKWEEDPAFYRRLSVMLEDAILAFRQHRNSDLEYLNRNIKIMNSARNRTGDDIPEELRNEEAARAFYGIVREELGGIFENEVKFKKPGIEISRGIDKIIRNLRIVDWQNNTDIKNRMRTEIEDFLFEVKEKYGFTLSFDEIDKIMEDSLAVARARYKL